MAKLFRIVKDNAKSIRERCVPVEEPYSQEVIDFVNQMHDYLVLSQDEEFAKKNKMREGVGLAAPQVGRNIRALCVFYEDKDEKGNVIKTVDHRLINPKLISESVKLCTLGGEGCLSVDDAHEGYVYRPYRIIVDAYDVKEGKQVKIQASGYEAIVLQHEMDHLNGVLFYDHINKQDPFYDVPGSIKI